jgi:3-methyladenine DNA glycosylase Tag
MKPGKYTWPDWFSEHIPVWRSVLQRRLTPRKLATSKAAAKSMKKRRFLFVGPYDGQCIEWVLNEFGSNDAAVTVVVDL